MNKLVMDKFIQDLLNPRSSEWIHYTHTLVEFGWFISLWGYTTRKTKIKYEMFIFGINTTSWSL